MSVQSNAHLRDDDRFLSNLLSTPARATVCIHTTPESECAVSIFCHTTEQLDSLIAAATEARRMLGEAKEKEETNV